LRETRACLICITHWTFEYVDGLPFPDILQVIDMHVTMKTGKKRRRHTGEEPERIEPPEPEFGSLQEKQAYSQTMAKENAAIKRAAKHITTQPLFVQQAFAMRNKSLDEINPKWKDARKVAK
jgi:hypothetical protein